MFPYKGNNGQILVSLFHKMNTPTERTREKEQNEIFPVSIGHVQLEKLNI